MNKSTLKYFPYFLSLIILVSFKSCIDPFKPSLNKNESEYILVVEGLISNEPGSFEVKIGRSVPIDTLVNIIKVSGALVTIYDDNNNVYELEEVEPGRYKCLDESVKAIVGRNYHLSIIDSGNNEYESTNVLMERTPDLKSIHWEETTKTIFSDNKVFEQNGIDIFVDTNDPTNSTKFYKWDIIETWEVVMPNKITALDGNGMPYETFVQVPDKKKYCWVTRESQDILVKSVDNKTDSNVENFIIKRIEPEEDKLFFRYSLEVKQYRLNKSMYEFWNKLKEINQDAGSLYDQVPGSTYGNISCCDDGTRVLGYFYAADLKTKRIFINPGQHSLASENYYEGCLYVSDRNDYHFVDHFYARSEFCSSCQSYGSNKKPDFW